MKLLVIGIALRLSTFVVAASVFGGSAAATPQSLDAAALPRSGGPTISVAAADASPSERRTADLRCDGTADHVEIQAAVERLRAGGGGSLSLTSGTFLIDAPLLMTGRSTFQGQGRGTVVKASPTFQGAALVAGTYTGAGAPLDLLTLTNFVLDGSKFQGVNCAGIRIEITSKLGFLHGSPDAHTAVRHVLVNRCSSHGLHLLGGFNRQARITGVRAWDNGGDGFRIESADGNVTDCDAGSSDGAGFRILAANTLLTACKGWYSDDSGFVVQTVRCTFANCSAQDNALHGFDIRSGIHTLTGCHADSNSYLGSGNPDAHAGLYDGFHIGASSITMSACLAYDKNEGGRGLNQRYGTFVESGKSRLNLQVSNGNGGTHDNLVGGIGGFLTGQGNRIVATGQDEFVTP